MKYKEGEKRELIKYYIQLGVVFGSLALIPYCIDKYYENDNDFCMWSRGVACDNLENKIK